MPDIMDLIAEILDNPKLKNVASKIQSEYHDEPILRTAAQMARRLPKPLADAKKLAQRPNQYHYSYNELFLRQAKLLEDFTDNAPESADFFSYYPTYRDMSDRQLRTYFTWRTKVRRGIVEHIPLSYAEVYCFELLNQIGVPDPETGFQMLRQFYYDYGKVDPHNGLCYFSSWMHDYVIYYGMDAALLEEFDAGHGTALDTYFPVLLDEAAKNLTFYEANVLDRDAMNKIFDTHQIDRVIHFAGFKAVGESVSKPVEYYHNNIENTLVLIDVMRNHGCKSIIFSSSSTVYGDPDNPPVTEEDPKKPATNPYGWTKWMIEQILMDVHTADPEWDVVLLRYFNPIGAHPSGLIGEDPKGIPNNLVPYVAQVAVGKLEAVQVFGNDYPTPDGTGVRDYIHVCDLASGHVAALNWMNGKTGVEIFNLGTGTGTSVLEVVAAFSKACGKELPYVIRERRAGDIAANWCDASKAERMMGWKAQYDIADMCRDSWNWQSHNPNGFADAE